MYIPLFRPRPHAVMIMTGHRVLIMPRDENEKYNGKMMVCAGTISERMTMKNRKFFPTNLNRANP